MPHTYCVEQHESGRTVSQELDEKSPVALIH